MLIPKIFYGEPSVVTSEVNRLVQKLKRTQDLVSLLDSLELTDSFGKAINLFASNAYHGKCFYIFKFLEKIWLKDKTVTDDLFYYLSQRPWGTLCLLAGPNGMTQNIFYQNRPRRLALLNSIYVFFEELFDSNLEFISLRKYCGIWGVDSNLINIIGGLNLYNFRDYVEPPSKEDFLKIIKKFEDSE